MKVTLLLADAAQTADGKLYVLGGGWSICGPNPTPMALALKIEVPWDQANVQHECRISLLDGNGQPVEFPGEDGEDRPLEILSQFEVGRPPGLKPGRPIDVPLAINIGPLPLDPGELFEWRVEIDGETDEDWRVTFSTRSAPA